MIAPSVWRAERIPGEPRLKLRPSAAHAVHQYFVWRRIDRVRRASDHPHFRPHAVLQPGGGTARGVGWGGDGGDAYLRCDLRSLDRGMVRSHPLAMGPAPSVHVRLRGSGRDRILLPVRSPARMAEELSARLHGRDVDDGASAAEPL